jgi:hypothetical protein
MTLLPLFFMPRFGWSAKKPPQYLLPVDAKSVRHSPDGSIIPTDAFVRQAANKLMGDSDETPRFFVIPNTEVISSDEKVQQDFVRNLIRRLGDFCQNQSSSANGQPLIKAFDMPNSFATQSTLHFDQLGSSVISMLYGYNRHVKNAAPRVADLRQACRDQGCPDGQVSEFLNSQPQTSRTHYRDKDLSEAQIKRLLNERPNTVVPSNRDPIEKDYTLTLDVDQEAHKPLLVINNSLEAGIVHCGPADIRLTGPREQAQRPIWYAAFRSGEPAG